MSSFDKIVGYESVKKEFYQIIDMFKNREMYEKIGAKFPKGILIYGDPGMGKTMLANALIQESKVKSFIIKKNKSETDLINEIRNIFNEASQQNNSIIMIDDIDKFSEESGKNVDDNVFITIQSGIDSVKEKNVLIVATANNHNKLPDSLKRNGRFDRKICLKSPTRSDANRIIEYYMKSKCVNENLNYEDVSKMISYTSCADLETILNESAIYAAYQRKDSIDIDDITKAYLRDLYSSPDEHFQCSNEELQATSIHEAGHAVIAEVLKRGSVGCICINTTGRNNANGSTHLCEDFIRRPENVLIALGGKAAVELFNEGKCGSGCQNDLMYAVSMIRDGINDSGTSGLSFVQVTNLRFSDPSNDFLMKSEIATSAELERYMFIARDILIKNKEFVFKIAEKLKDKHVLLFSDVRKIREQVQIIDVKI